MHFLESLTGVLAVKRCFTLIHYGNIFTEPMTPNHPSTTLESGSHRRDDPPEINEIFVPRFGFAFSFTSGELVAVERYFTARYQNIFPEFARLPES